MKIRTRVAAIIIGTMVLAVAATAVFASFVLLRGFESLEVEDARDDLGRAVNVLEAEVESVSFKAVDWAMWDDTYAFLAAPDSGHPWIRSNIVDETFASLQIDMIAVVDLDGAVAVAQAYDPDTDQPSQVPDSLIEALQPGGPLHAAATNGRGSVEGVMRIEDGAALVAAHAVTDSSGSQSPRGVLVMARRIDASLVTSWSQRIGLSVHVDTIPATGADTARGTQVFVTGEDVVAATGYPSVRGRDLLRIEVRQPRGIVEAGRFSIAMLSLVLIATLGAATLLLTPALDRMLLRRLRTLTRETTDVGIAGQVGARVAVEGRDEVTELAQSINGMLAGLERAHQEQELRNVELVEALEGKDRFVSTVAHELRTPITALKGLALTLMRADDRIDPTKQRELLGRLSERADSMEHLVEELLTMSRLAAGKVTSVPVPIDLEGHIRGLLDDLTTILPDVRADLQPDAVVVADPDHLARILINLLDNARRYGAPPLEVRTRHDGDAVELVVSDHGRGITPDDVDRLFERFEQMDHTGGEGLGLGLSIVRSLAELNDGDIRYVDTPEGGATFIVRLPAGDQQDLVMHHHISDCGNLSSRH